MPVKKPRSRRPGADRDAPAATSCKALQLQRLQLVARARLRQRAALPRGVRREAGVHPRDLKALADLAKFPFTTKTDLRDNYPFGMFAVPREQVVRIHASSGTTGKPTVVGYTRTDIDTWADLVARSIRAAGGRAGDIVHVAYGYGLFTGGLGAHYGAEKLGCTVIPMSGGQTEKQVQLIRDFKPRHHHGDADLHAGDRRGDASGRASIRASSSLKVGIFGAEPWTEAMRRDDRGSARHRRGRHLRPVRGDGPGRGQRVHRDQGRPGDLGGPLLSRDHRSARPARCCPTARRASSCSRRSPRKRCRSIRYRTRDLTRLLPPTARSMRRIGQDHRPLRRHADHPRRQRVPDADRGADPAAAAACRGSTSSWSRATARSTRWRCAARCCRGVETPTGAAIGSALQQRIKTLIGVSARRCSVGAPDSIERTLVGKARRVIDKRPR